MATHCNRRVAELPRPFQFTIRTMLLITAAVAMFFGLLQYVGTEVWWAIAPNGPAGYLALTVLLFSWHAAHVRRYNTAYGLATLAWHLVLLDIMLAVIGWFGNFPLCPGWQPPRFLSAYHALLIGFVVPFIFTIPVVWLLLARPSDPLFRGTKWGVMSSIFALLDVFVAVIFMVGIMTVRMGCSGETDWSTFLER